MKKTRVVYLLLTISLLFSFNDIYSQVQNFPFPDEVSSLSFSPDGKYIAGSVINSPKGEMIYLWEQTGGLIKTYKSKFISLDIHSLDISQANDYIMVGGAVQTSGSGLSIIWEIESSQIVRVIPTEYPVYSVSISPDGKYFVIGSANKLIPMWTINSPTPVKTFKGHSKAVFTTVFSPDSKYFYSGSKDKKIIQWDVETGENVRTLLGHTDDVTSMNISRDGKFLVSGSNDNVIHIWDLSSGNSIKTIVGHDDAITSVCFSPDGKYVISASVDKTSKVFEASSGMLVRSYIGHEDVINAVDISPDAQFIATGSDDRTIKLWNSNIEIEPAEEKTAERTTETISGTSEPLIVWQVPVMAIDTSIEKDYTLRAFIQSGSRLENVNIYHNSSIKDYDLALYRSNPPGEYNLNLENTLALADGNNILIIKVTNTAGSTTSEIRSVYFKPPLQTYGNEVIWESPSREGEITDSENFNVKVCLKSRTKITQISLFLNNNLWAFERTVNLPQTSLDCTLEFEKEVNLQKGTNQIKVEAINEDNLTITANRTITFQEITVERRLALVIGNSEYSRGEFLLNPVNDALAMADVLQTVGFEVESYTNADQKTIKMAMDKFGDKLENYQVGLFYYAGHGVQVDGNNYIIPVDANLSIEQDVEYDCVEVGRILGKMEGSGCETNIIILDACRDNPFERRWSGRSMKTQGLAFMNAPSGSIIAYSTSPGKTASDGTAENGLYTGTLLKYIQVPDLQIEEVFKNVRSEVEKISDGKQTPWESTSLKGRFYFVRKTDQPVFR